MDAFVQRLAEHWDQGAAVFGSLVFGLIGVFWIYTAVRKKPNDDPPSWIPPEIRAAGPNAVSDFELEGQSQKHRHQHRKNLKPE